MVLESEMVRQGGKLSVPINRAEVYGFVGSIVVLTVYWLYIIWAYVPESVLHAAGISYYPSKYWAVVLPAYCLLAVFFALVAYTGLNHLSTPPPDSFHTLHDKFTKSRSELIHDTGDGQEERPIPSISDLSLLETNQILFGNHSAAMLEAKEMFQNEVETTHTNEVKNIKDDLLGGCRSNKDDKDVLTDTSSISTFEQSQYRGEDKGHASLRSRRKLWSEDSLPALSLP